MSELIKREDVQREIQTSFDGGAFRWQDGQDLMDRINALPTASPWHRVEDELPEIGKAVVVSIYGDMWVATRLDDKRFNGRMYLELSDGSWERVENDMYWMPIEPPKEEA